MFRLGLLAVGISNLFPLRSVPLRFRANWYGAVASDRFCSLMALGMLVIAINCVTLPVLAASKTGDNIQSSTASAPVDGGGTTPQAQSVKDKPEVPVEIDEYRIVGADNLTQIDVEEAVYPFLGPHKTSSDVELARAALEKAYHNRGYRTVSVAVPDQDLKRGVVVLVVNETKVGNLQVKGSRYFDLDQIKKNAPSLDAGKLINLDAVTQDLTALNLWQDRRITPALRAGVMPGTVDVDLNVEDTFPLHGSAEINNRQSSNTTETRLNLSMRYDNLWQLGHSLSLTYQIAPQRPGDTQVISANYLAHTDMDWLNVMVSGVKSYSSVATVGSTQVVGAGQTIGGRVVMTLPSVGDVSQTVSIGFDYKDYKQRLSVGSDSFSSPLTYVPFVAAYNANQQSEKQQTQFGATVTAGLRGIGSDPSELDIKRYKATSSFITLHGDASHMQEFDPGYQLYGHLQGQIANQPLVSSEQFSLGGQDTVRGYFESEVIGDFGGAATVELRSPNLASYVNRTPGVSGNAPTSGDPFSELRFFSFFDAGYTEIFDPLPDQTSKFRLASYGIGMNVTAYKSVNSMIFLANPTIKQGETHANHSMAGFRLWGEF